jgi:hypothetical protein
MIKEIRKKIDRNAEPDWAGLAKLEDTCVDKEKQGAIITTNERDRNHAQRLRSPTSCTHSLRLSHTVGLSDHVVQSVTQHVLFSLLDHVVHIHPAPTVTPRVALTHSAFAPIVHILVEKTESSPGIDLPAIDELPQETLPASLAMSSPPRRHRRGRRRSRRRL